MCTQYRYLSAPVKISSAQPQDDCTLFRGSPTTLLKSPSLWLRLLSLGPTSPIPPILPSGRALIRSVSSLLRSPNLDVLAVDVSPGPTPWMLSSPEVPFTPLLQDRTHLLYSSTSHIHCRLTAI
ncbi:hypothetical protein E2C01_051712 [Portunus trituberculatus]|uniref:Uncharacterized protein n=1 Tax=Portunus trituberculatus TaxID=210409 RepID=A0A5B7GK34_PORTR|nr:hypothetical protein [Portunus trituberculatus]